MKKRKPAKLTPAKQEANRRGQRTIRDGNEAAAIRDGWESAGDALKAWRKGAGKMVKTEETK